MGKGDIGSRILNLALYAGEELASRSGRFTYGERSSGTSLLGVCVGSRTGLDDGKKNKIYFPCRESNLDSWVVQPVSYLLYQPTREYP
jgi:hypothetical protein